MSHVIPDLQLLAQYPLSQLQVVDERQFGVRNVPFPFFDRKTETHYRKIMETSAQMDRLQPLWVAVKIIEGECKGAFAKDILACARKEELPELTVHRIAKVRFPGGEMPVDLDLLIEHTSLFKTLKKIEDLTLSAENVHGLTFSPKHYRNFLRIATEGKVHSMKERKDWLALYFLGKQFGNNRVKGVALECIKLSPYFQEMPRAMRYVPEVLKRKMLQAVFKDTDSPLANNWLVNGWVERVFENELMWIKASANARVSGEYKRKRTIFYDQFISLLSERGWRVEGSHIYALQNMPLRKLTSLNIIVKQNPQIQEYEDVDLKQFLKNAKMLTHIRLTSNHPDHYRCLPSHLVSLETEFQWCRFRTEHLGENDPARTALRDLAVNLPTNLEELTLWPGYVSRYGLYDFFSCLSPELQKLTLHVTDLPNEKYDPYQLAKSRPGLKCRVFIEDLEGQVLEEYSFP